MKKQSHINTISMIFVFNLQYDSSTLFLSLTCKTLADHLQHSLNLVSAILSLHSPSYLSLKGGYIDV